MKFTGNEDDLVAKIKIDNEEIEMSENSDI